jgi:hypothetical protein
MRKWGIVISIFYALILLGLILPGFVILAGLPTDRGRFWPSIIESNQEPIVWLPLGILFCGEALLLFLSVDTSFKRLKPRAHILVSCTVASILMALLTAAGVWSLGFGVAGEKWGKTYFPTDGVVAGFCAGLWVFWGIIFLFYLRDSSTAVTRLVSWLLKGSVLELLIAVPCHVIVRRRHECSAPIVTGFGIATGLAIMFLAFGPSVLFLYKKRLDSYSPRPSV